MRPTGTSPNLAEIHALLGTPVNDSGAYDNTQINTMLFLLRERRDASDRRDAAQTRRQNSTSVAGDGSLSFARVAPPALERRASLLTAGLSAPPSPGPRRSPSSGASSVPTPGVASPPSEAPTAVTTLTEDEMGPCPSSQGDAATPVLPRSCEMPDAPALREPTSPAASVRHSLHRSPGQSLSSNSVPASLLNFTPSNSVPASLLYPSPLRGSPAASLPSPSPAASPPASLLTERPAVGRARSPQASANLDYTRTGRVERRPMSERGHQRERGIAYRRLMNIQDCTGRTLHPLCLKAPLAPPSVDRASPTVLSPGLPLTLLPIGNIRRSEASLQASLDSASRAQHSADLEPTQL